jgi:anthraniloyl-CoA monooxygenase
MTPALTSVVIVGGGPGGLFLATLLKRGRPHLDVTVLEQNRRTDSFGFGVVFSDATLRNIDEADPVLRDGLRDHGRHWDRIEVWSRGERHGFSGNGMAAIHRKALLNGLQSAAEDAGARLLFETRAPSLSELRDQYDVVVGADGTNSSVRRDLEAEVDLGHEVQVAAAKFIWFGTTHIFDGLTFVHRASQHGNFAVHGYPISENLSTFIVETDEETWRRAGLDAFDVEQAPGPSDSASQAYLEALFAEDIAGGQLVANNSRWSNFRTRRTAQWSLGKVVLLGDAVHTAHFSVGSGTKMAMEDSVVLAEELLGVASGDQDLAAAFATYSEIRKASVARIQAAAASSLAWWERFGLYQRELDPATFSFHFFSRSIGIDKIAQRDPELAALARQDWLERHGSCPLDSDVVVDGVTLGMRSLTVRDSAEDVVWLGDGSGTEVQVPLVQVSDEIPVPDVTESLPLTGAVVIWGPAGVHRNRVAEEARLCRGLTTIIAGGDLGDPSVAETLVLSGRADAVAVPVHVPAEV